MMWARCPQKAMPKSKPIFALFAGSGGGSGGGARPGRSVSARRAVGVRAAMAAASWCWWRGPVGGRAFTFVSPAGGVPWMH
uniref:Putative secreted protein n=1 Tax=Ixodes ricinus TaxID=34613 RepID=A0A6B0TWH0_IXORI